MGSVSIAPTRSGSDPGHELPARVGGAREAMYAVTRLLGAAADLTAPEAVRAGLVDEAREFFGVSRALLLSVSTRGGRVEALATSPASRAPPGSLAVSQFPALAKLLEDDDEQGAGALLTEGDEAERIDRALGSRSPAGTVLLLPMRSSETVSHVLLLADGAGRRFDDEEVEVAGVFAAAASASLAQMRLAELKGEIEELRKEVATLRARRQPAPKAKSA